MPADVAWMCAALGLQKPIIVGHSMGGNIALWNSPHITRCSPRLQDLTLPRRTVFPFWIDDGIVPARDKPLGLRFYVAEHG